MPRRMKYGENMRTDPKVRRRPRSGHEYVGPVMGKRTLLAGGFILFSLAILILSLRLLAPFAEPLAWAAVIAFLVYPLHRLILRLTGHRSTAAAIMTTILISACGVGPAVFMVRAVARESRAAYAQVADFLKAGGHRTAVGRLAEAPSRIFSPEVSRFLERRISLACKSAGDTVLRAAADLLGPLSLKLILDTAFGDLPRLAASFLVFFISVFFFLKDGALWVRQLTDTLPLEPSARSLIMRRLTEVLHGVLYGLLAAAVIQALLFSLGFWIFGVPFPLLFGILAFFTSVLPIIGPSVLWIPACAWLYFSVGNPEAAIGLFAYSLVVVSPIETFLQPYLIGKRVRLPVLLMMIAILGGIIAYGPIGIFLGPILIGIGMATAGIYRELRRRA